jgi:hypothetical protein
MQDQSLEKPKKDLQEAEDDLSRAKDDLSRVEEELEASLTSGTELMSAKLEVACEKVGWKESLVELQRFRIASSPGFCSVKRSLGR